METRAYRLGKEIVILNDDGVVRKIIFAHTPRAPEYENG